MLAELKVGKKTKQNTKPKTPQKPFTSFLVIGYSPLLMGDPQPNLKYRIITKREDYGPMAGQAPCPEMVWVRWKVYMTLLRPGTISKHSKWRWTISWSWQSQQDLDRWRRKVASLKRGLVWTKGPREAQWNQVEEHAGSPLSLKEKSRLWGTINFSTAWDTRNQTLNYEIYFKKHTNIHK